ncbi:hypothetical protein EJ05DRAFT_118927 [Pseudovirgaria hyperparasitica]|uniref:Uncharacterized protein n=1 Tax=Pseudovirgaria hyperparasitica TaxID=470096 RepID=A0A6A6W1U1_9PEZI|nr:uncharacterized protein EJ05DRAFT_118927 [Pseudovirgaria hyperparasitica]KAF2755011.1 hypothetical protein EJ05DRAFT_118927 [Pseudovirgaria hyperparasitica]
MISVTTTKSKRRPSFRDFIIRVRDFKASVSSEGALRSSKPRQGSSSSSEGESARHTRDNVGTKHHEPVVFDTSIARDPLLLKLAVVIHRPPTMSHGVSAGGLKQHIWSSSYITTSVADPPLPPFRLLDLPGELRNQIYENICILPDPINVGKMPRSTAQGRPQTILPSSETVRNVLRFLATNIQINAEALPIFYGRNTWEVAHNATTEHSPSPPCTTTTTEPTCAPSQPSGPSPI